MEHATHPVTTDTDLPATGRNLALQSRRTLGLTDLLSRRPDLRGVSTWSEVAESVLWSV
jgi:hypothetical protein